MGTWATDGKSIELVLNMETTRCVSVPQRDQVSAPPRLRGEVCRRFVESSRIKRLHARVQLARCKQQSPRLFFPPQRGVGFGNEDCGGELLRKSPPNNHKYNYTKYTLNASDSVFFLTMRVFLRRLILINNFALLGPTRSTECARMYRESM
jgi:hypothetical protein